ncbi:hypothetical protein RSSM_01946 [Rhodopirellula sallentina SM41]|uniref:Uncharacterized protein n=1 Tax=Rhodopirellula sallentina SM41 TaxID=1263870 RepID=M5UKS4_9BACT|nr:hypothetical protein RSSM_01946 [Rhodopirellula sallentina SM41]
MVLFSDANYQTTKLSKISFLNHSLLRADQETLPKAAGRDHFPLTVRDDLGRSFSSERRS